MLIGTAQGSVKPPVSGGGETSYVLGLLFDDLAGIQLLKANEEVRLAMEIERGRKAMEKLPSLRRNDRRRKLLARDIESGKRAADKFFVSNVRLVVSIAKRYRGRGVPFEDLVQEGNLGLQKAIGKFDHRKGTRFGTYATWWIRQAVSRSIANQSRVVRLPVHVYGVISKVYKAISHLRTTNGSEPSIQMIADELDWDVEEVTEALQRAEFTRELDAPVNGDRGDRLLIDTVGESVAGSDGRDLLTLLTGEQEEKELLYRAMACIDESKRELLELRFGFVDEREWTYHQIGERLGVNRDEASRVVKEALADLKQAIKKLQPVV